MHANNNEETFVFGSEANDNNKKKILNVLQKYITIFGKKIGKYPAKMTPMKMDVAVDKWRVRSNQKPARIFSSEKIK